MGSKFKQAPAKAQQQQGTFSNLLYNILIPVILLTQGDRLTNRAELVLVVALAFPLGYFAWDYHRRRKANFISILGFVSVLLTGGVGLLELPRKWFILKETAIPLLIGLAVLGSRFTRYPLIRALVYSKEIFDVERIQHALRERGNEAAMERRLLNATVLLAGSFLLSAVLNFFVASHFIRTEPSDSLEQFNAEVGAMTGWSYLIIAVPSMLILFAILWWVVRGIRQYAGLSMEEAMAAHHRQ